VTPIAGTTRDVIEETANIRGIPVTAIDTAGLRETEDLVERIGVERARTALESAALVLFVFDASVGWTADDERVAATLGGQPAIWVANKIDLTNNAGLESIQQASAGFPLAEVSARTGEGIKFLERTIADTILGGSVDAGEGAVVSNARHEHALRSAVESLARAEETTSACLPADFISIDLRAALDSLGLITGETATDDVIHRIFHDFCVGK